MSAQDLTQEQSVDAVYEYAAGLMKAGTAARLIETRLVERGLSDSSAAYVVRALRRARGGALVEAGVKNAIFGVLLLLAAGAFSLVVGMVVSAAGGNFTLVTRGLLLVGALQLARGLWQFVYGAWLTGAARGILVLTLRSLRLHK